jgi:hypothetical protein
MSKKKNKPESQRATAKPESSGKALTVIIILCFLGILPVLVWVSLPEASPYTSVTSSSAMIQTAAVAAGLQICSQTAVTVKVPGATSAVLYQMSPSCSSPAPQTTVQSMVVGFSSTDAQNAAISMALQTYTSSQGMNLEVFTSGYNVILVQGSPTNPAVRQFGDSLRAQGATQIV